jgi:methionyl-tRNA synthetase
LFDANKYFNDQEPWKKKSDIKRLNTIVYVSLEIIRKISILLNPIIPKTSLKVLEIFNLKQNDLVFDSIKNHESLISKNKIKKIDILFKKIEKND